MFRQNKIDSFQELLKSSSTILVLLPPKPSADLITAGLALHSSLKKADKKSTIGCSSNIDSQLPGVEEIQQQVGNQNLIISFPYKAESVGHVSYDIDKDKQLFNLRIKPSEQGQPLDPKQVEYSFSGAQADLVITIGIKSLAELGKLYSEEKEFIDESTLVNIHLGDEEFQFPTLDINARSTGVSEAVSYLLKKLNQEISQPIATILYQRLLDNTNHFKSSQITPQIFKTAAYLLENNAKINQPTDSNQPPFFEEEASSQETAPSPNLPTKKSDFSDDDIPSDWQKPKIYHSDSKRN